MTDPTLANLGSARLDGERARHRHRWERRYVFQGQELADACICGAVQDPAATRRGRSHRRLGLDNERRLERLYGPTKVGEFGDAIDLLGRDFMWQAKASRSAPPLWLAAIDDHRWRSGVPAAWVRAIEAMARLRSDLAPLLARSHVANGVPTRDWVVVRGTDWIRLHGISDPPPWLVMSGAAFLDVHGRDER